MSRLVSCVMPTADRRRFVPNAIENFLLQTYPRCELVIVDDGRDAVADLVPDHPSIRYERLERKLSVGAKRNAACAAAHGDIFVHWDDDDWSAPDRVAVQVAALLDSGADVCGVRDLLFYEPAADRGWRYRYPPSARPWVAGGTMCYRRSLWETHPFPDVRQGEDTQFVWSRRSLAVHAIDRRDLYVATIHGGNTSAKRTSGRRWSSVPTSELAAVFGDAGVRYLAYSRVRRGAGATSARRDRDAIAP
jgi:glycosyltransferase involved in cell wall biosynthesis